MHIIIVGAGEVGRYLSEILIEESHDVCIVESNEKLARELNDRLDAQVIAGTGISRETLFRAGIDKADLLLAVTEVDEVNLIAAITAEKIQPKCQTVARVRDRRYLSGTDSIKADEFGIDLLVGPEQAVADHVVKLLEYEGPGQVAPLSDGKVLLLELPVMPHSTLVYATLEELNAELPDQSMIAAVLGEDGLRIASPSDRFKIGERIYVLCTPGKVDQFLELSGTDGHKVKKVLIVGGGSIGFAVAKNLQRLKFNVTIIEKDHERAEHIATKLNKSTVILGDATDPDVVAEQMKDGQDAVAVLLGDDERSLLVGIMAKHLGANKVITRVDKRAYSPLANKIGIDAMISPKRAVADEILRFVRRGQIASTTMLGDHQGEIIDFQLDKKPKKGVTDVAISELKLPAGSRLTVIVRDEKVIIPRTGEETLQPLDHVFILALRQDVSRVESLFAG